MLSFKKILLKTQPCTIADCFSVKKGIVKFNVTTISAFATVIHMLYIYIYITVIYIYINVYIATSEKCR